MGLKKSFRLKVRYVLTAFQGKPCGIREFFLRKISIGQGSFWIYKVPAFKVSSFLYKLFTCFVEDQSNPIVKIYGSYPKRDKYPKI